MRVERQPNGIPHQTRLAGSQAPILGKGLRKGKWPEEM